MHNLPSAARTVRDAGPKKSLFGANRSNWLAGRWTAYDFDTLEGMSIHNRFTPYCKETKTQYTLSPDHPATLHAFIETCTAGMLVICIFHNSIASSYTFGSVWSLNTVHYRKGKLIIHAHVIQPRITHWYTCMLYGRHPPPPLQAHFASTTHPLPYWPATPHQGLPRQLADRAWCHLHHVLFQQWWKTPV